MVTMTVSNSYGDLYAKALRNNGISFLFEIDGGNTIFTIKEEDLQMVSKLMDDVRKSVH